jgi:hypothetical protein
VAGGGAAAASGIMYSGVLALKKGGGKRLRFRC